MFSQSQREGNGPDQLPIFFGARNPHIDQIQRPDRYPYCVSSTTATIAAAITITPISA
jgi:hypothetical protein